MKNENQDLLYFMGRDEAVTDYEYIKIGQEYIKNPSKENIDFILQIIKKLTEHYTSIVIKIITTAIKDGTEKAISYGNIDDMTEEQLSLYSNYACSIQYKVANLDIACVFMAIIKDDTIPQYKTAVNRALKEAEKQITYICNKTQCNVKTAAFVSKMLFERICNTTYDIYNPKQFEEFQKYIDYKNNTSMIIVEKINKATTAAEREALIKLLGKNTEDMTASLANNKSKIYELDKVNKIIEKFLRILYKNKNVEIDNSNKKYDFLLNNSATHMTKKILNNANRVGSVRRGQVKNTENYLTKDTIIAYKGNDSELTFTLERTKELFAKRILNGAKVFNFLLQKLNEQHKYEITKFQLSELVDNGMYANKDSAAKGLKNVLDKIYNISVEGMATEYNGTKKQNKAFAKSRIISSYKVSYNECIVSLTTLIRESTSYITLVPTWSYTLNENSYMLLDYIYYIARQQADKIKKNQAFNINLDAVRVHLGLPRIEETHRHQQLIVEPIENAITDIEDKINEVGNGAGLKITPIYNFEYENIYEYLQGYLHIELDEVAQDYMFQRAKAQEKKYKKANKKLKSNNDKG